MTRPTGNPNSNTLSKQSSTAAAAAAAASASMRNRRSANTTSSGREIGRSVGGSSAGILRFYTDDAPGLKVGPTMVLILSLCFIGCVVLLHIWGKFVNRK